MSYFNQKKRIFAIGSGGETPPTPTLMAASRSAGQVSSTGVCELTINANFRILCSVPSEINTGDTAYLSGIMAVYNGANNYFNVGLDIWPIEEGTRNVRISNLGIITVIGLCETAPEP